jgi:hypothetical protein
MIGRIPIKSFLSKKGAVEHLLCGVKRENETKRYNI